MSDDLFAKRVVAYLDASAEGIDGHVADRLRAARQRAVSNLGRAERGFTTAWSPANLLGRWGWRPAFGAGVMLIAVAVLFSNGGYRTELEQAGVPQEIDAALLMDELPIEAYLDPDFRAWLLGDS